MKDVGVSRDGAASLALVALLAFAIRLIYILVIAPAPVGVGGDAGFYHSAANLIAKGHFYYRGIFGHAYKTAEHPPLFSLVLSISSLLGWDSLLAHRIVGCLVGSGAVVAIGLLGRVVGGGRVGIVAALIAAVFPPFVTADGLVMSEPLFVLIVAVVLLLAYRLLNRPTVGGSAVLGAAIGFATLTRGEGLLLLPLLAWPAAYLAGGRGRTGARSRAARVAAATAAMALVLAPWVARNLVVFHRLTLGTDANTLIAGANCHDTYYGHDIGWWSLDCLAHGRTLGQLEIGDASTSAALSYAGSHPDRLPLVAAVRVLRTFDLFQPLRQGNRELRRHWVDVVGLVLYYPLLVLAVLGWLRLGDRARPRADAARTRPRWPLLAPIWMVVIVSLLGWGIGRFRVAADIVLVVLAAAALAGSMRRSSDQARALSSHRRRATIAASNVR
jgi:4-amino-4-deoxy-L-arabinose transferase-like glycosyltransferase